MMLSESPWARKTERERERYSNSNNSIKIRRRRRITTRGIWFNDVQCKLMLKLFIMYLKDDWHLELTLKT